MSKSPLGRTVKIKSKFDGTILTGKCKDEVDWLVGVPVVETKDGLKDIGYHWDLLEILDNEAPEESEN